MLGIIIITLMSLGFSILLVITNYYLNRIDPRVAELTALLPGYNCGACGYGGCADFAENIIKKGIDPKQCKPLKPEQYDKIKAYLQEN